MNIKDLTVFTPTYNRKDLISNCYYSLKRQTSKNFIWLIIDDGSTDNTSNLVKTWIEEETEFEIKYFYKQNGGLHTGYNYAINYANTELCMCVDSDDFLPDNAIEKIWNFWESNKDENIAGIIGLDIDLKGNLIGLELPKTRTTNSIDLMRKFGNNIGDKKYIVRTDLYKKFAPMRSFAGEKNFNPHYMHLQISKNHEFLVLNDYLCIVDYQPTGMSNNLYEQYYNSPNSFAETRKLYLSFRRTTLKFKIKNAIHYVSSCLIAKRKIFVKGVNHKILIFFVLPLGFVLKKKILRIAKAKGD